MSTPVLEARDVTVERRGTRILDRISLAVSDDDELVIQGRSGAGKSTLFQVLGLLDAPTEGSIIVGGRDASGLGERKLAQLRRDVIGFVFQDFQLVPDLTAFENAALPQEHTGERDEEWLRELFSALEISYLLDQYPATLSGGEKQRVAIARALANRPDVVLADEPTGQLDPETAERVVDLLMGLDNMAKRALLVVTHDQQVIDRFSKRYVLEDGALARAEPYTRT